MPGYTTYYISLDKPVLLFFPSCPIIQRTNGEGQFKEANLGNANRTEGYVVQVTIRQAHNDEISELTKFFHAQFDITKAVESVLFAHILTPLPSEVQLNGNGYVLRGRRRPWNFGRTLKLTWGDETIRPCDDKWVFVFELSGQET